MTFWLIAGLGASVAPVLIVVALIAGAILYWTLYTAGGRSTGRTARDYFGWRMPRLRGPDGIAAVGGEGWAILLKLLDPRWWALVVHTTGWPVGITTASLLGSLGVAVLAPFVGWT